MKYLFFALSFISTLQAVSQDPDPDLFQTWYLRDIYLEFGPPLHLLEPPVYPFLVIEENMEFNGLGSCNTFTGTYEYDPVNETMGAVDFERTNEDCVFEYHNQFETQYFITVREPWYFEITNDGTGQELYINSIFDSSATFTNYPLSVPDKELDNITVYPNPADSQILINAQANTVTKIELHNLLGEAVGPMHNSVNSIDISHIASGIYLLRIYTEEGVAFKKIVKN